MLILKDEHTIDVLNSGNIVHLWHDLHAIDVHATDVGDPDDDDDDKDDDDDDNLFGILLDELSDDGCGGIDRGG